MREQFDLLDSLKERDKGIAQVARNNEHFLKVARADATEIAERNGDVTSDDVRRVWLLDPRHPNAWGAVFKGDKFTWTGQYRQSHIVSRHGGMQRVWRLAG